mmetsp:Transcript_42480/g.74486  ORF Transcript_42480/g.74486 Transcript_42480/m.74486 type:complete len:252 (+) Transcript_42480:104-859(+)
MDYTFAAREQLARDMETVGVLMADRPALEDIVEDPIERSLMEAYCMDLERLLMGVTDEARFLERTAILDQQFSEALFAYKFGGASSDPMQAMRQPPSSNAMRPPTPPPGGGALGGGVLAGGLPNTVSSGLGARVAELHHRHAAVLEGLRRGSSTPPPPPALIAEAYGPPPQPPFGMLPGNYRPAPRHPAGAPWMRSTVPGTALESAVGRLLSAGALGGNAPGGLFAGSYGGPIGSGPLGGSVVSPRFRAWA